MQIRKTSLENYTWIDISKPNETDLPTIAEDYNLDLLLLQDSLEAGHLPKYEKRDAYTFFILRVYTASKEVSVTRIADLSSKVAFFLRDNQLITIHKKQFDFLNKDEVQADSSYALLIELLNEIVNSFVEPAKWNAEDMDNVEKVIFLKNFSRVSLEDLYYRKSEIRLSKKLLILTQQVFDKIQLPEEFGSEMINVRDTLVQLLLEFDEALDDSNNLMNTYLSVAAQKSNDVMKVLTVFSVFFLPLGFIVGLYGMNFAHMPELGWKNGYFYAIGLMLVVCLIIYLWFKKKRYL